MADNTVTIVGNLVDDPDLRFNPSGVARANLRVAVNRRWFDRNINDYQEEVSFFSAVCWRDLAENVADSLSKGTRVIINGRLQQRTWETEQGEKRNVVEITIDEIGPSLKWATAAVTRSESSSARASGGRSSRPAGTSNRESDKGAPF